VGNIDGSKALCGTMVLLGHMLRIETPVMERIYKHLK
jgi:hypothetical protein